MPEMRSRKHCAAAVVAAIATFAVAGCGGSASNRSEANAATAATGAAPEAATRSIEGTYRWTLSKEDALAHGTVADQTPDGLAGFPSTITVTLRDGQWAGKGDDTNDGDGGPYVVVGNTLSLTSPDEGTIRFTYTVDGDGNLHLEPVPPMDKGAQFVFATHPVDEDRLTDAEPCPK
jgi:hypothetical protein